MGVARFWEYKMKALVLAFTLMLVAVPAYAAHGGGGHGGGGHGGGGVHGAGASGGHPAFRGGGHYGAGGGYSHRGRHWRGDGFDNECGAYVGPVFVPAPCL